MGVGGWLGSGRGRGRLGGLARRARLGVSGFVVGNG